MQEDGDGGDGGVVVGVGVGQCSVNDLPDELVAMVCAYVNLSTLFACMVTSKLFHRAADAPQTWYLRCLQEGFADAEASTENNWKQLYQQNMWSWDPQFKHPLVSLEERNTVARSSGTCQSGYFGKTVLAKHGFVSGRHMWGIHVTGTEAGCYSSVGVATRDINLQTDHVGYAENSWGIGLSPSPERPSGPHRAQVPLRLEHDALATFELDLDKGTFVINEDGQQRAKWTDLPTDLAATGKRLYPLVSTCHHSREMYTLLAPRAATRVLERRLQKT
eukprot:TRINITY_DN716_c1_g3_i3.p1 TRINITY_DN716_c1_g3~~TRINITY_DN716_c1_g3_i3.p1  ORF type:complete len:287 (-),score=43.15 TRINITY_DN716_c1_g3_i3:37-864(-)